MKEFFRKKLVGLKRNPQVIALLFLIIACAIFTFNLGAHSNTSVSNYSETFTTEWAKTEQGQQMGGVVPALYRIPGLYVFVLTLFSILSVISYLSVYKRGKLSVAMLVVTFAMLVVMCVCDFMYVQAISFYAGSYGSKKLADVQPSIINAYIHMVANIVAMIFMAAVPLMRKLLNLIDTSVEDEYDKLLEAKTEEELLLIDIEDEA